MYRFLLLGYYAYPDLLPRVKTSVTKELKDSVVFYFKILVLYLLLLSLFTSSGEPKGVRRGAPEGGYGGGRPSEEG